MRHRMFYALGLVLVLAANVIVWGVLLRFWWNTGALWAS